MGNELKREGRKVIVPVDLYNSLLDLYLQSIDKDSRFLKASSSCDKIQSEKKILDLLSLNINKCSFLRNPISCFILIALPRIELKSAGFSFGIAIWDIGTYYLPKAHDFDINFQNEWKEKSFRGLIGGWVLYVETWTPLIHYTLPRKLRDNIKCIMTLTLKNKDNIPSRESEFNKLPREMLYNIFGYLTWSSFSE